MPGISLRVTRLLLNGDVCRVNATLVAQRPIVAPDRLGPVSWAVAGTIEAPALPAMADLEIEAGGRRFRGRARRLTPDLPPHGWIGALRQIGVGFRYDGEGDLEGLREGDFGWTVQALQAAAPR